MPTKTFKNFTLTEYPDKDALKNLCFHKDIWKDDRGKYYDYYNKNSELGINVKYEKKYKYGRYYTSGGTNACVMWNKSRSTLFKDTLFDIDLVNAHFNILKYVIVDELKLDIETPFLDRYLKDRDNLIDNLELSEEWIKKHNITNQDNRDKRDIFKLLFIIILFGGTIETWRKHLKIPNTVTIPKFAKKFQDEFRTISKEVIYSEQYDDLINAYKEYKLKNCKTKDDKEEVEIKELHDGCLLSAVLQHKETEIMEETRGFLNKKKDIDFDCYCYDGFMINKNLFNDDILNDLNNFIGHKFSDNIKFINKSFKEPLDLDENNYIKINYKRFDIKNFYLLDNYNWKKEYFENFYAKLENPKCILEYDDNGIQLHKISQMEINFKNLECIDPETFKKNNFCNVWLKDIDIKIYSKIVFTPPPEIPEEHAYNLWKGFPIEKIELDDSANTSAIWKHFKYLSNFDKEVEDYLIKWLAHIIKQPANKPNTAILLKGLEGTGKSVYAEQFLKHILGQNRITITSKIDMILGLNSVNEGKLLTVLNEASGGDTYKRTNLLKDYVTQTTTETKKLYHDPITTVSRDRLIFTTNNVNAIPVTKDNRRWVIVEVSEKLKGDWDYFDRLYKDLDDLKVMRKFYEELKGIELVDWKPGRFPITELAKDIYELNENVYDIFADELTGRMEGRKFKVNDGVFEQITGCDLYCIFREFWEYSGRNMNNIPTNTKFAVNFKSNKKVSSKKRNNGAKWIIKY